MHHREFMTTENDGLSWWGNKDKQGALYRYVGGYVFYENS